MRERKDFGENKYILLGLFTIGIAFTVVVVWGFFSKIETYVIAPGKVVIETFKKPVQYKEWGNVSRVFVKEGDFVEEGEPLIELEKLEQRTNYSVLNAEYYNLLGKRDRLISEKKGLSKILFSKEFLNLKDSKLKEKVRKVQEELFKKRRDELNQQISVLKEKIAQTEARIKGLNEILYVKINLLNSYRNEIEEQRYLVEKGLVNNYRLLDLERDRDRVISEIEDIKTQIKQLNAQVSEYKKQISLQLKSYKSKVTQELEEVLSKLDEIRPKLKYATERVRKTVIKAPCSGQVIGLKVYSKGEVVKPGDILMYIVPKKESIFIMAKVFPKDRDKVHVGQMVDLQFPSFLSIAATSVEGKVSYISDDTLPDEKDRRLEYYEAHIVLTEKGKKQLRDNGFILVPGMPAVAYIKAERLSPIEYLIQPLIILIKSAFRAS
ncbi:epimerase transport system membrane fusion protein [Thermovibrio guaymasensis]|uniref:Epimerase transport system membrane fusion protein n=1 Tax=Thermovibrio guaymasensis TaxID=240167 RepID=A0A420W684_9BACT|nr:HlyD family type I secretion periplasmic adaptor subunit [Thermovibrio guaymasensis]RKQ60617.1 epimerase transport system membrane fusion protein [Thermovibrio guaymasensis]